MKSRTVFLITILSTLVSASTLHSQSYVPVLINTFTNPTATADAGFGTAFAAVGTDRMLIGAYQDDTGADSAGAAYLFNLNGTLLTTFTNPTPAFSDNFGDSVAAVGNDRVLIGARDGDAGVIDAGVAYLFDTNGALLTTFTNPWPAAGDRFGLCVAAAGDDRVLIGAYAADVGATDVGAAYLFDTNGTLLTTFTNPAPAVEDLFGLSVVLVGTDRVLMGAWRADAGATDAGAAYLFNTNGALLTTFTNPTPAMDENFGVSVAAMGSDRVLIGAIRNDTGATDAGAAYLFSANGALLTTFTNPTPAFNERFGNPVAAVGADKVLVGGYRDDMGANDAGAAYLFNTNGVLLTTFTNPTPANFDRFGYSLAAAGSDKVLIGTLGADTAYLFSLVQTTGAPSLSINLTTTNTAAVSWSLFSADWELQQNTNGLSSLNWSNVSGPFPDDGTNKIYLVNPPTGEQYFRLFKP